MQETAATRFPFELPRRVCPKSEPLLVPDGLPLVLKIFCMAVFLPQNGPNGAPPCIESQTGVFRGSPSIENSVGRGNKGTPGSVHVVE